MAKIILNNKEYTIADSTLAAALANLQSHLSTTMSGEGAVINLGGVAYNVDSTKLSTAANAFASRLGTIAGEGAKIVINGTEYSVDSAKIADAVTVLGTAFGELEAGGDDAQTAGLYDADGNMTKSWEALVADGDIIVENGEVFTPHNEETDEPLRSLIGVLVLPNDGTIVKLPWGAFRYCGGLEGITLPDSLTTIGGGVFWCSGLKEVVIPDNVTSVGDWAFMSSWLESAVIGSGITEIPRQMFEACSSLTSVTIPDSVTSIGDYAFAYCDSLTNITFEGTVAQWQAIEKGDRWNASWNDSIPATYVQCSDGRVMLREPVDSVGLEFASNDNGTCYVSGIGTCTDIDLVIPAVSPEGDSVIGIHAWSLSDCNSLTSVVIPDSMTEIASWSFAGCGSLTYIWVGENNTAYMSVDGNLYSKNGKSLNQYAIGKTDTEFAIPDGVQWISEGAVSGCRSLTSVTIPDSVTSIGIDAFSGCSSLTSVVIPNSVMSIDEYAFSGCSSLTSITIPDSVTSIGNQAFYYCDSLTDITFNGTTAQWAVIYKGYEWNGDVPATYVQCSDGQVAI